MSRAATSTGSRFLKRRGHGVPLLAAAAATALVTLALYARHVAPYRPRLERFDLPLPPAHVHLAGLRIGFVTDTHLGPFVSPTDLARACRLLEAAKPDLVLFGGDYVSESPRFVPRLVPPFARLAAAAPLGAFAVLGNHDLANSADRVTQALVAAGITILRNRAARVDTDRGSLWIAGVDEAVLARPDPAATFAAVPPGAAVLALWHEPDLADQTAALGAFAQLSGHSHGGQIDLPGLGPFGAPAGGRRYPRGPYRVNGMTLYTSRGIGVYRPPVRVNCPPEVTLVTLVAPPIPRPDAPS